MDPAGQLNLIVYTGGPLNALYVHSANVNLALDMTIVGIYLHSVFVSFTLGFPLDYGLALSLAQDS